MKPIVRNAADEDQVREAGVKVKDRHDRELNDIRSVMSTVQGRRFMWRLINELCHYDRDDAQHSGSLTYFSLGERNVGRQIKSDTYEASHESYQQMERENWSLLKGDKDV